MTPRAHILNTNRGWTLLELVIAVALISILSGIGLTLSVGARERARITTCMSNLHQIQLAISMYVEDYRTIEQGLPAMPSNLGRLYPSYITNSLVFQCPSLTAAQGFPQSEFDGQTFHGADGKIIECNYYYLCIYWGDPETGDRGWRDDYLRRRDNLPIIIDFGHTTQEALRYDKGDLLILRMDGRVEKITVRFPSGSVYNYEDL